MNTLLLYHIIYYMYTLLLHHIILSNYVKARVKKLNLCQRTFVSTGLESTAIQAFATFYIQQTGFFTSTNDSTSWRAVHIVKTNTLKETGLN